MTQLFSENYPIADSAFRSDPAQNKLMSKDQGVHNWYRFVLSFPAHLVREYVERFAISPGKVVLDPFCGTGTTLVECKKLNIDCMGVEANPMAWFASRVKTNWDVDPNSLLLHANRIAVRVRDLLTSSGISDDEGLPLFKIVCEKLPALKELLPEANSLLLKNSISPLPLHKVLLLLEAIEIACDKAFYDHERLALAAAVVFDASNLSFGPEVGVTSPKVDADVVGFWLRRVKGMASDLKEVSKRDCSTATVVQGDARTINAIVPVESVDAVITSPPYPNEKDYTRTTRLESVLLGFFRNKHELQMFKRNLLRSNTRGVYKSDEDDRFVEANSAIQEIAEEIERRRISLGKTSGFERQYARVTKLYFGGMAQHLANLQPVLRPGAKLAYVVGDQASYLRVKIPTGQILADVATSLGYEVLGLDLFRDRLATVTKEHLREEVLLLRWPQQKKGEGIP